MKETTMQDQNIIKWLIEEGKITKHDDDVVTEAFFIEAIQPDGSYDYYICDFTPEPQCLVSEKQLKTLIKKHKLEKQYKKALRAQKKQNRKQK